MCFSGFWSHAIRDACKTTSPFIVGRKISDCFTSHRPHFISIRHQRLEKPVAFGKVSGNPKLHCELQYFHFTGSLSVSCQERFQRLLQVAQAHRWRSLKLGFANFKKKTRQRLLKRPSVYEEQPQGTVEYSASMASFSFITTLSAAENIFANCFG